jgi:hypothetical protein
MRFPCKSLYLQEYSIILPGLKQEKNDTKTNYFNKLTQSTFYETIKSDGLVKSPSAAFRFNFANFLRRHIVRRADAFNPKRPA